MLKSSLSIINTKHNLSAILRPKLLIVFEEIVCEEIVYEEIVYVVR